MGLESKIITALYTTSNANYATELIEKIAENFAIGFAEWKDTNQIDYLRLTTIELLEIYKKTL